MPGGPQVDERNAGGPLLLDDRPAQAHRTAVGGKLDAVGGLALRLFVLAGAGCPRLAVEGIVQMFPGEGVRVQLLAFTLNGAVLDAPPKGRVGRCPAGGVFHVADLRHAELEPRGFFGFAVQCPLAQGPEHGAHGIRAGRGAHIDGLGVQAGRNGRDEAALCGLVQLLCLVEDEQVAVLAASAVAGTGQKLDLCAAL